MLLSQILLADVFEENEQRNRQRDIFENLNKDPSTNTEIFKAPEFSPLQPSKDEQCFDIKNITVLGATLISKSKIDSITARYLDKCTSLTDLKNLTNEINALYVDKGYITSQAYLSAQNIAEGNVTLQTIEGKIKNILPQESYIKSASVNKAEDFLNIRDIEILIENANRLPSNHASMKLNPAESVGYTDILIENSPTKRFGGYLGVDNFGGEKTGRAQISGKLNIDNPVGINDQINILYNTSDKHYKDENSIGKSYEYSFPLGRTTLSLSQRNNRFKQNVRTGNNVFLSEGETRTYTFDTQYRIYHDQKHRLNTGVSISNYRTKNYFADAYLESSSYRLSKLSLSGDYSYQVPGFYTFVNLAYVRGVDLFNNYHSTALDDEYEIYNLSLSLMKDFAPFRYSLSAYSQFTNDSLFGSDKISIGGVYSVRGFNKEGLSGNSGYYVRNELSYNLAFDFLNGLGNSYFIALDGGAIKSDDDSFGGQLLGYAAGAKLQNKYFETTVSYSMPAYKKDVTKTGNFFGVTFKTKF
jgi:hemolysin activation/secretion protein